MVINVNMIDKSTKKLLLEAPLFQWFNWGFINDFTWWGLGF